MQRKDIGRHYGLVYCGPVTQSPLLTALIAELLRSGALKASDLSNMQRRLEENGHDDAAQEIDGVFLAEIMDDPDVRRQSFEVIGGGNED